MWLKCVSLGVESSQTKRLVGQICLVTGATREIGRAIAQIDGTGRRAGLYREEAVVQAVEELARHASGKVEGKAADVRDSDQVAQLFRFIDARFGGLDVSDLLDSYAGVGIFKSVSEISLEQWKATIETSLCGGFFSWVFWGTREALLRFETRGRGYIVNIGSRRGRLQCFESSEAAMQDLRRENVRLSYVIGTAFGGSPEGIYADREIWPGDVVETVKMLLLMPARISEPGGGSIFKTSSTGAEEVNGAYESAGSGEHLKKWY